MKKISVFLLILLMTFSLFKVKVEASFDNLSNAPYSTLVVGLKNNLVASSTAYEGLDVLNFGFNKPSDLFIKDDLIYISDTGNKRIVVYNFITKEIKLFTDNNFIEPTGITVDDYGYLYVADGKAKAVFKFDRDFKLVKEFLRPKESLYGEETQYIPLKVAVDKAQNLYITSQGNANGIVEMNKDGEFLGYFGPNKVKITMKLLMKRMFMSKEDKEIYASLSPKATTNLTIDKRNTVYSVIDGEMGVSLKKFNVNGLNILAGNTFYSSSYQDITVDDAGFIYAVSNDKAGAISVIDPEGNLLFKFGNTKTGSFSIGQFDKASGIEVDRFGNIWVLDSLSNSLQVFEKTTFAQTVINALLSYNKGSYDEALKYYNEVLEMNSNFVQAYVGLGKIYERNQNYDEALEYFKIANYKAGYSEVFWELRDDFLSKYFILIIILIAVLLILKAFHVYHKLYLIITPNKVRLWFSKIGNSKFVSELKYLGHILIHPFDTFYDLKFGLKIRMRTAVILFIFFVFSNIFCDYVLTGYLFEPSSNGSLNLAFEILKWGLILLIFMVSNYLISTLQNGEGFFRDIFIGTIYSFAPLILFRIPLAILSNVLTYNEGFIYDLGLGILWGYSILLLIMMIKDIHNYKLGALILNIFLTFITMIIIVLVYLMVYILSMQFINFFVNLIKEAVLLNG